MKITRQALAATAQWWIPGVVMLILCSWGLSHLYSAVDQFHVQYIESQQELALQVAITNSLVSEDAVRVRVAEYLGRNAGGKLSPEQCVAVSVAIMDGKNLYSVPPTLTLAVMRVESGFDPNAKSSKGAIGIMQILPSTARPYLRELGWRGGDVAMALHDPALNTRIGVAYLYDLIQSFGPGAPQEHAVASYFWGEGNIRAFLRNDKPIVGLQYAQKVMLEQKRLREAHLK